MQKTKVKSKWTGGEVGALIAALIGTAWTLLEAGFIGLMWLFQYMTYLIFKDGMLDGGGPAKFPDFGEHLAYMSSIPLDHDVDIPMAPFYITGIVLMIAGFVAFFVLRRRRIRKSSVILKETTDGGNV